MNILVVNDDGIDSQGLWALAGAMARVGQVLVVAPDRQQSGVSGSISLHEGTSVIERQSAIPGVRAYAVGGTPSDCTFLGIRRLSQGHIDLVVSGINLGPNIGRDIPYSGTVMATLQGYFRKIPSIAVSLCCQSTDEKMYFNVAARFVETLASSIKDGKMKTDAILNVNVPNVSKGKIKGIVTTRAASMGYVRLSKSTGNYTLVEPINPGDKQLEEGTDIWAVLSGFISITPLQFEVTHHEVIPTLVGLVRGMEGDFLNSGDIEQQ
ncbi:MAG: 5'/3'-nucleotidase SurE [Dehalococcoidales bacterium]|nr:5'/3'-nucleotidase SurE [Dehalococcoidales bacterium]